MKSSYFSFRMRKKNVFVANIRKALIFIQYFYNVEILLATSYFLLLFQRVKSSSYDEKESLHILSI